jgi:hypothetical protein
LRAVVILLRLPVSTLLTHPEGACNVADNTAMLRVTGTNAG